MEQYFQFTGLTLDDMQEEMKPQALEETSRTDLFLKNRCS